MELPQPRHRVKPDIKALGTHGGTDFFDVTFVHPLTPARIPTLPQCPLRPLNQAENVKERRFARLVQDTGPRTRLVPIPMSTLGGWHPETHAFMCSLADSVTSRAIVERRVARQALFRRHAARLVQTNANGLLEGIFVSI